MESEILIRKAEERDVSRLAELDALCFSLPWSLVTFQEEITENPLALYLVSEIEGNVIGYAGLWKILDEGHITNVAVDKAYRRKGFAEALLKALLEEAYEAGASKFTLEVRASNAGAIALYQKFGFVNAGCRRNYYEDNGEDALILWKE